MAHDQFTRILTSRSEKDLGEARLKGKMEIMEVHVYENFHPPLPLRNGPYIPALSNLFDQG